MILSARPAVFEATWSSELTAWFGERTEERGRRRRLFPLLSLKRESLELLGAIHFAIVTAGHRV
jgi:hypothetical protein